MSFPNLSEFRPEGLEYINQKAVQMASINIGSRSTLQERTSETVSHWAEIIRYIYSQTPNGEERQFLQDYARQIYESELLI